MNENTDMAIDAPPHSSVEALSLSMQGFDDGELAEDLGQAIGQTVIELGRTLDLTGIDGVTVGVDYDAALSSVDRGVEGLRPEERTNDGDMQGVAKAVTVRRGKSIKTHLVFSAGPVAALGMFDAAPPEDVRLAVAIIAHECAHVEEHDCRELQFPGSLLGLRYDGIIPAYTQQFSEAYWCEYAVCRRAAKFCADEETRYRHALEMRLRPARRNVQKAIDAYRKHGDIDCLLPEVAYRALEPLRSLAYLCGHLDGMAALEGSPLPRAKKVIGSADPVFAKKGAKLIEQMRDLYDRRESWSHHKDMQILGQTALEVLDAFGIEVRDTPNGAYINVP